MTAATRVYLAETFLSNTTAGSNKGYVLRIYRENERYFLYTNYGPRSSGMNRSRTEPVEFISMSRAINAYYRKIATEEAKGYVACSAAFIGCEVLIVATSPVEDSSADTATTEEVPIPIVVTPEASRSIWTPHLYTTTNEDYAQQAINDPTLIFQRKYDGERMRIVGSNVGTPFACNRRGITREMSPELMVATNVLISRNSAHSFDFDGEIIGTNRYVVWDNMLDTSMPYLDRFMSILSIAGRLPTEFVIAETAFTSTTKRAMLQKAKDEGWEGIMIKQRYGEYINGRSRVDWKYPFTANVTVRLTHINPTTTTQFGSAATEIRVGDFTSRSSGNVAGGFTQGQLQDVAHRLTQGEIILADIRYKNWTGNAFYQPKFERFRTDLAWSDCLVTELRGPEGLVRDFR